MKKILNCLYEAKGEYAVYVIPLNTCHQIQPIR